MTSLRTLHCAGWPRIWAMPCGKPRLTESLCKPRLQLLPSSNKQLLKAMVTRTSQPFLNWRNKYRTHDCERARNENASHLISHYGHHISSNSFVLYVQGQCAAPE